MYPRMSRIGRVYSTGPHTKSLVSGEAETPTQCRSVGSSPSLITTCYWKKRWIERLLVSRFPSSAPVANPYDATAVRRAHHSLTRGFLLQWVESSAAYYL